MITQETAAKIWACHREIETAEKLLTDIATAVKWSHDKTAPLLKDAFGHKVHLQLGIPCGENSHRLFGVPPELAGGVIRAHMAGKRHELVQLNECARIELAADLPQPPAAEVVPTATADGGFVE